MCLTPLEAWKMYFELSQICGNFTLGVFWILFQRPNYKQILMHMLMEICPNSFILNVILPEKSENFTFPWFVGNSAKVHILKQLLQENTKFLENEHFFTQIRAHISNKCSFFGTFSVFCFLATPVVRFALLSLKWLFYHLSNYILNIRCVCSRTLSNICGEVFVAKIVYGF